MILWTFLVIILLFLLMVFLLFRFKKGQLEKKKEGLEESFWQRRHRIPLLLEITEQSDEAIIDVRAKLMRGQGQSSPLSFSEELVLEGKLTGLLEDLFQKIALQNKVSTNVLFLALRKEFSELFAEIETTKKDYVLAQNMSV